MGLARDARGGAADGRSDLLKEGLGHRQDVLAPVAQRRQADLEDPQSVVEVLAELAAGEGRFEIAVGRRHDPHVRFHRPRRAEALELALLQDAQELGLDGRGHLPHLVEKQDAPRGLLDAAGPRRDRPGERPLLVPEQLGLQKVLRQGGAVERHEGAARAGRAAVHEAGHDLLAGPRFPGEQHRRLGRRHLRGLGEDRLPLFRVADHAAVAPGRLQLVPERVHTLLEPGRPLARLGRLALLLGQTLVGQRKAHVIRHPAGDRDVLLRVLARGARGEDQRAETTVEAERNLEDRAGPVRAAPGVAPAAVVRLLLDVADQDVLGLRLADVLLRNLHLRGETLDRLARYRIHGDLAAVGAQRGEHQTVVRQHRPDHLGDPVEDFADVEAPGHRQKQRVDGIQAPAARGVEAPQPLVLEGQAHQDGDRPDGRLALDGEGGGAPGPERDGTGERLAAHEGCAQAGPQAALQEQAIEGVERVELALRVVDADDAPGHHPDGGRNILGAERARQLLGIAGDRVHRPRVGRLEASHRHDVERQDGGRGLRHAREHVLELEGAGDGPRDATESDCEGVRSHDRCTGLAAARRRDDPGRPGCHVRPMIARRCDTIRIR